MNLLLHSYMKHALALSLWSDSAVLSETAANYLYKYRQPQKQLTHLTLQLAIYIYIYRQYK